MNLQKYQIISWGILTFHNLKKGNNQNKHDIFCVLNELLDHLWDIICCECV